MADIINEITGFAASFARSNPLIFFGTLAIVAFLIYQRPKAFFLIVCLCLIVAAAIYIIMEIASSGVSKKERMIHKEAPVENVSRLPGLTLLEPEIMPSLPHEIKRAIRSCG